MGPGRKLGRFTGETVADDEDEQTKELDEGQAHQHGGLDFGLGFGVAADGFDGFTDADAQTDAGAIMPRPMAKPPAREEKFI